MSFFAGYSEISASKYFFNKNEEDVPKIVNERVNKKYNPYS